MTKLQELRALLKELTGLDLSEPKVPVPPAGTDMTRADNLQRLESLARESLIVALNDTTSGAYAKIMEARGAKIRVPEHAGMPKDFPRGSPWRT